MTITTKIYGPPGTGKTTRLMGQIEEAIESGIPMKRIAFISMTRKAVNEAISRAKIVMEKIDKPYEESDFSSFSTLHSFATRMGEIPVSRIMIEADYEVIQKQMADRYPSYIKNKIAFMPMLNDISMSSLSYQDVTAARENMKFCDDIRIIHSQGTTNRTIPELIEEETAISGKEVNDDWIPSRIERINNLETKLKAYKLRTNKMEFNDIIEEFYSLNHKICPSYDIIFVDEAQDLDLHQWECVKVLQDKTAKMIIAGDPDQSIFRFGGASPELFINFEADETSVLDQSFRIPSSHHKIAQQAIRNDESRTEFAYKSKSEEGVIKFVDTMERDSGMVYYVFDMQGCKRISTSNSKKTVKGARYHYINRVLAAYFEKYSTITSNENQCYLREGDKIIAEGTKLEIDNIIKAKQKDMYEKVLRKCPIRTEQDIESRKVSLVASVKESIDKGEEVLITSTMDIPLQEVRRILEHEQIEYAYGNNNDNDALVRVATLFKAKGGEADKVIFIDAVSDIALRMHELHPQDLYRLYYVGLTRSRHTLEILPYEAKGIKPILDEKFQMRA